LQLRRPLFGSTATKLIGIMRFSLRVLVEDTVIMFVVVSTATLIRGSLLGLTNLVEKVTHISLHKNGCYFLSESLIENNERSNVSVVPIEWT